MFIRFLIISILFIPNIINAKPHYINDYQAKAIYSKRQNNPMSANGLCKSEKCPEMIPDSAPVSAICANHNPAYKARADLRQDYICTEWDYGAVTCCRKWKCDPSTYPYTSCSGGKTLKDTCTGNAESIVRGKSCS